MLRLNVFSKRKNKKTVDIYEYDKIPVTFRRQIVHIWSTAIGGFKKYSQFDSGKKIENNAAWSKIHSILCREIGVFSLGNEQDNPLDQCQDYIQKCSTENVLDIIETSFFIINTSIRAMNNYGISMAGITQDPDDAISELNERFLEHGLGYQFIEGHIIRVDSQFTHNEIVKPALKIIHQYEFIGAEQEFISAFTHYNKGRYKESLNDALKSFESILKSICERMEIPYNKKDCAKKLIDVLIKNELISSELISYFSALRTLLESGIPTIRNVKSAHGQGPNISYVPQHLVSFVLNMTASSILFLVQESFMRVK